MKETKKDLKRKLIQSENDFHFVLEAINNIHANFDLKYKMDWQERVMQVRRLKP